MFDPLRIFLENEGTRWEFINNGIVRDHLASFSAVSNECDFQEPFEGTIIRLPLRADEGNGIGSLVQPNSLHELLLEFISDELSIVMLFLRSVVSIEIREIDSYGNISTLATARVQRYSIDTGGVSTSTETRITVEYIGGGVSEATWCVVSRSEDADRYAKELSKRLDIHISTNQLRDRKLFPDVALAVPVDGAEHVGPNPGRLFTVLPLPIFTGLPCMINGIFAVTADRQHLRNPEENVANSSVDQ